MSRPSSGTPCGPLNADEGLGTHVLPRRRLPLPESQLIAGYVSFPNEKLDIPIDGRLEGTPDTVFSSSAGPGES